MAWETDNKRQKEIEVHVDRVLRESKKGIDWDVQKPSRVTKTEIIKDTINLGERETIHAEVG